MYPKLSEERLSGEDCHDLQDFQIWLTSERDELTKLRACALPLLALHTDKLPDKKLEYSRLWHNLTPFDSRAANCLLVANRRLGLYQKAEQLTAGLRL